jgi:hypothetical protein
LLASTAGAGLVRSARNAKLASRKITPAPPQATPPSERAKRSGTKVHKATIKATPRRIGTHKRAYLAFTFRSWQPWRSHWGLSFTGHCFEVSQTLPDFAHNVHVTCSTFRRLPYIAS